MIVKILGLLDILTGLSFWLFFFYNFIPESFLVFFAFLLLIKGASFLILEQIASIGDVISALVIFLALYVILPEIIVIIITLYLLQKGAFSFL